MTWQVLQPIETNRLKGQEHDMTLLYIFLCQISKICNLNMIASVYYIIDLYVQKTHEGIMLLYTFTFTQDSVTMTLIFTAILLVYNILAYLVYQPKGLVQSCCVRRTLSSSLCILSYLCVKMLKVLGSIWTYLYNTIQRVIFCSE